MDLARNYLLELCEDLKLDVIRNIDQIRKELKFQKSIATDLDNESFYASQQPSGIPSIHPYRNKSISGLCSQRHRIISEHLKDTTFLFEKNLRILQNARIQYKSCESIVDQLINSFSLIKEELECISSENTLLMERLK